jgi:hypothetical protein
MTGDNGQDTLVAFVASSWWRCHYCAHTTGLRNQSDATCVFELCLWLEFHREYLMSIKIFNQYLNVHIPTLCRLCGERSGIRRRVSKMQSWGHVSRSPSVLARAKPPAWLSRFRDSKGWPNRWADPCRTPRKATAPVTTSHWLKRCSRNGDWGLILSGRGGYCCCSFSRWLSGPHTRHLYVIFQIEAMSISLKKIIYFLSCCQLWLRYSRRILLSYNTWL